MSLSVSAMNCLEREKTLGNMPRFVLKLMTMINTGTPTGCSWSRDNTFPNFHLMNVSGRMHARVLRCEDSFSATSLIHFE
jgi:hypothetical protein